MDDNAILNVPMLSVDENILLEPSNSFNVNLLEVTSCPVTKPSQTLTANDIVLLLLFENTPD